MKETWNLYTVLVLALTGLDSQSSVLAASGPNDMLLTRPVPVVAGFRTTFKCSSTCTPQCTYTWSLKGREVSGSELTWVPDRLDSIVHVKCTAQNPETGESYSRTLETKIVPWIVSISGPDTVVQGKETKFTCLTNCSSNVDCTVNWQLSGSPIGRHFSVNRNELKWTPSVNGTLQNLTCVVENEATGHSAVATKMVEVQKNPNSGSETVQHSGLFSLILSLGLFLLNY